MKPIFVYHGWEANAYNSFSVKIACVFRVVLSQKTNMGIQASQVVKL